MPKEQESKNDHYDNKYANCRLEICQPINPFDSDVWYLFTKSFINVESKRLFVSVSFFAPSKTYSHIGFVLMNDLI
jgi:hypothetical protein